MSAATQDLASDKPTRVESLGDAVRVFVRHPSPWLIGTTATAATIAKLLVGGWSLWDLGVALGIVAFWPIQEWLIHVFILHFKPVEAFGREWDMHVAVEHRRHHREPWDLDNVFVPTRTIVTGVLLGLPLFLAVWWATLPIEIGLTAVATFFMFGMLYEWAHFLIHTGYKPKSEWYRKLWRNHRLHHFKNENYWFGVSRIGGDKLLGTDPDPKAVEKSSTVRDIV